MTVQRIRLLFLGGGLFFLGGILLYFWLPAGAVWLSLSFFSILALTFWYLPAYCRSVSYVLREDVMLIHTGVYIQKTILIRRDRVQYVRLFQTPAARRFHTAALFFFLAGQRLWLGELALEQAERLQEVFAGEGDDPENPSPPNFSQP